jgi:hypothetical protein
MSRNKNIENNLDDFPPIGALMVSKLVAVEKQVPLFMYREKRARPEDSGWRIFSGYEPDGYADNPENIGIYNPSTILKIDPSIAGLLLKGVGSVFERDAKSMEWRTVEDFEMEDDYMVTQPVTGGWAIHINNLFERSIEESGDLFFTTGDKSVRITAWDSDKDKSALYAEYQEVVKNRDQSQSETIETFEFSDAEAKRIGYRIKEGDSDKTYSVIYGFSIIDHEVLMTVLYYDDEKDRDWAIQTWRGIRLAKE